jgi:heme-degrading monooxygenase HmoA
LLDNRKEIKNGQNKLINRAKNKMGCYRNLEGFQGASSYKDLVKSMAITPELPANRKLNPT